MFQYLDYFVDCSFGLIMLGMLGKVINLKLKHYIFRIYSDKMIKFKIVVEMLMKILSKYVLRIVKLKKIAFNQITSFELVKCSSHVSVF